MSDCTNLELLKFAAKAAGYDVYAMNIAIILLAMLCAGCKPSVDSAAYRYTCTDEQFSKAVKEAKEEIEIDTVEGINQHNPSYWINAAIMRNCTPMMDKFL